MATSSVSVGGHPRGAFRSRGPAAVNPVLPHAGRSESDATVGGSGTRRALRRVPAMWRVAAGDAVLVAVSVASARQVGPVASTGHLPVTVHAGFTAALAVVWCGLLVANRAYDPRTCGRGLDEYRRIVLATVQAFGGVGLLAAVTGGTYARVYFAVALPLGIVLLFSHRFVVRTHLRAQRERGRMRTRVLLVGGAAAARSVTERIARNSGLGYEVVGVCIPAMRNCGHRLRAGDETIAVLGGVGDVQAAARSTYADVVAFTDADTLAPWALRDLGWTLHESGIGIILAPVAADFAGARIRAPWRLALPFYNVDDPGRRGAGDVVKAVLDRLGAVIGLILLMPVFATVVVLIKCDDRGPVFYRQERVGKDGRVFRIWKFRSMVPDADAQRSATAGGEAGAEAFFKDHDDFRVTRIGRVLRSTSMDELPQLLNVLTGQMSLVGPRPLVPGEGEEFHGFVRRRGRTRPGMTGLWQISGRSDLPQDERVRLDLKYLEDSSLLLDATILVRTIRAVSDRTGAY